MSERCDTIWRFPFNLEEYMPHSYTPGNALYNQKLAEGVKQTVAKYHSDPPAGYWIIWEKRYNIGPEIHSKCNTKAGTLPDQHLLYHFWCAIPTPKIIHIDGCY